jgi:uncharacterized membrane-anchored protein YitT (DUF2179 family)
MNKFLPFFFFCAHFLGDDPTVMATIPDVSLSTESIHYFDHLSTMKYTIYKNFPMTRLVYPWILTVSRSRNQGCAVWRHLASLDILSGGFGTDARPPFEHCSRRRAS